MALDITSHTVETEAGVRRVLICAPDEPIVAGRAKLEALRANESTSTVDLEIVERIETAPRGSLHAFVFRGHNDARTGSWRISDELSPEEIVELGHRMFRSQLPLNRLCASHGMFDNFYVDWPETELDCFARGTEQIAQEIRAGGPLYPHPDTPEARLARLNLWLVERHTFYSSLELEVFLRRILPGRLARFDQRRVELARMLEGLPEGALDGRA